MRSLPVIVLAVALAGAGLSASAVGAGAAPVSPAWQLRALPDPHGRPVVDDRSGDTRLVCPSASWCTVLSNLQYLTTVSGMTAATVRAPVVAQPGDESAVVDVACLHVEACYATGSSGPGPWQPPEGFRDRLSGGHWSAHRGTNAWQRIACDPNGCVEIGEIFADDAGIDFGAIDDLAAGGSWVSRPVVTPWQGRSENGGYIDVNSVSCPPTGGRCIVLGAAPRSYRTPPRPLLFRRSNGVWHGVPQALPAGAVANESYGAQQMSCPTAGNCLGLGSYEDAATHTTHLFAERLSNGTLSATVIGTGLGRPVKDGPDATLSCTSMADCAGIVKVAGGQRLVHMHGGVWSLSVPAAPRTGNPGSAPYVADVSCAAASLCEAVGRYRTASSPHVLRAAAWTLTDGGWSVQAIGNPHGVSVGPSRGVQLENVDCVSTRCTVTGTAAGKIIYGMRNLRS